jgi:hypothetical protein
MQNNTKKLLKCPECDIDIYVEDLEFSRCYNCLSSYELNDDLSVIKFRHFPRNKIAWYLYGCLIVACLFGVYFADEAKYPLSSDFFGLMFLSLGAIACAYNFYIALRHGVISIRGAEIFIERNPKLFKICVIINFAILGVLLWFGVPMMNKVLRMISI